MHTSSNCTCNQSPVHSNQNHTALFLADFHPVTFGRCYCSQLSGCVSVALQANAYSIVYCCITDKRMVCPIPRGRCLPVCPHKQSLLQTRRCMEKVTSEKGIGKQRGHTDRERYGAPSHTPVLLQQLPPIRGSLECSKTRFSSATC